MAPTLYVTTGSPPSLAVLLTANAIGIKLNEINLDFSKDEHKTAEFLKLNPQHTVPTLVEDDGFVLWDSHAIIIYLVTKYAKDETLYPKDTKARALINQRLFFEAGHVFPILLKIVRPLLYEGKTTIDEADKNNIYQIYAFLEAFLGDKKWIAGESVTMADFSIVSTISSFNTFIPIDLIKHPKVATWLQNAKGLPVYEANKEKVAAFRELVLSRLK